MPQGRFLPHLHRDWAHHGHICTRAGLTPAVDSPLLWAHPCRAGPARCIAAGLTIDPAVVERLKDQLSLPYEELLILAQVTRRSIPRLRARRALQRAARCSAPRVAARRSWRLFGRRPQDFGRFSKAAGAALSADGLDELLRARVGISNSVVSKCWLPMQRTPRTVQPRRATERRAMQCRALPPHRRTHSPAGRFACSPLRWAPPSAEPPEATTGNPSGLCTRDG